MTLLEFSFAVVVSLIFPICGLSADAAEPELGSMQILLSPGLGHILLDQHKKTLIEQLEIAKRFNDSTEGILSVTLGLPFINSPSNIKSMIEKGKVDLALLTRPEGEAMKKIQSVSSDVSVIDFGSLMIAVSSKKMSQYARKVTKHLQPIVVEQLKKSAQELDAGGPAAKLGGYLAKMGAASIENCTFAPMVVGVITALVIQGLKNNPETTKKVGDKMVALLKDFAHRSERVLDKVCVVGGKNVAPGLVQARGNLAFLEETLDLLSLSAENSKPHVPSVIVTQQKPPRLTKNESSPANHSEPGPNR